MLAKFGSDQFPLTYINQSKINFQYKVPVYRVSYCRACSTV